MNDSGWRSIRSSLSSGHFTAAVRKRYFPPNWGYVKHDPKIQVSAIEGGESKGLATSVVFTYSRSLLYDYQIILSPN